MTTEIAKKAGAKKPGKAKAPKAAKAPKLGKGFKAFKTKSGKIAHKMVGEHGEYHVHKMKNGNHTVMFKAHGSEGFGSHKVIAQAKHPSDVMGIIEKHASTFKSRKKAGGKKSKGRKEKAMVLGRIGESMVYDVTPETAAPGDRVLVLTDKKEVATVYDLDGVTFDASETAAVAAHAEHGSYSMSQEGNNWKIKYFKADGEHLCDMASVGKARHFHDARALVLSHSQRTQEAAAAIQPVKADGLTGALGELAKAINTAASK